ncbi:mannonate dehydratase [Chloroflexota bacterium]
MKIGEVLILGSSLTDENMVFLKQLGVNHLTVGFLEMGSGEPKGKSPLSRLREGKYFETEDLVDLRKWVESQGFELSAIRSSPFPHWEKIILGQAGRDEQIENWNESLRNMGKAGIPMLQYNSMLNAGAWIPLWRTSAENVGRWGTRIDRFDYEVAKKAPLTKYGEISEKAMWDSLTYFLKAVIPVAEEAGVKMAMHPFDPQVPSIAGIARVIRSVEAFDRVFKIMPSKANSMNFCLGCFAQMMNAEGVHDAIRHFGKAGRIDYVHFRGVRGTWEKFDEVFPDEGKLDMLNAVKVLKEVGFNGIVQPDHAPHMTGDTEYGHIGHAFQIGYLKGILQGADALD